MKACLLLQRRFAYVGHKLAVILKEKGCINEFCGYVYLRSSYEFLKNQKEIAYTSLLLDEEIHNQFKNEPLDLNYINKIEKEYGLPNLWPYITVDRVVMYNMLVREYPYNTPKYTHEEMMRIFQVKSKAIISFLDREKPDILIMVAVAGVGATFLYYAAKKRGIKVLVLGETRLGDGIIISDNYLNFSWVEKIFSKLKKEGKQCEEVQAARLYLEQFRQRPTTFFYDPKMKMTGDRSNQLKKLLPDKLFRSLFWFLKYTWGYFYKKGYNDYEEENPVTFFTDRLRRRIRSLIGFDFLYDAPNSDEDFAFFPLHLEPEVATLLFAPFWNDQINLVRQIAKSLPLHFKLYVKEHPGMLGYRTHGYYRELKKIPNVKLINPKVSTFELIKNAKLISVITSSVGWEAILLQKPIITFGDVFFNSLSSVKKCENIERLPYLVKEQLENFQHDERELENFIGIILQESSAVGLTEIWERGMEPSAEKERLTKLANLIIKKIN